MILLISDRLVDFYEVFEYTYAIHFEKLILNLMLGSDWIDNR